MRISVGPILLIVVGTLLLLSNLGVMHLGQLKNLLKDWWPAILILVGILQIFKR